MAEVYCSGSRRRYLTLGGFMPHECEAVVAKYPAGANPQLFDLRSSAELSMASTVSTVHIVYKRVEKPSTVSILSIVSTPRHMNCTQKSGRATQFISDIFL